MTVVTVIGVFVAALPILLYAKPLAASALPLRVPESKFFPVIQSGWGESNPHH
jgi:hypothetical protein